MAAPSKETFSGKVSTISNSVPPISTFTFFAAQEMPIEK
jgi:hypothetical protein